MTPKDLTAQSVHVCVDMQRLFTNDGPWPTPWVHRILPAVVEVAAAHAEQTVFTRFIPPPVPEALPGAWQRYYTRWRHITRQQLDPRLLQLVPELGLLVPPAAVVDKMVYSPFWNGHLSQLLRDRGADALVVTGAESDVCVLATVLGAVDLGFPVLVVTDAICSSSDAGHDAMMTLYRERFTEQIAVTTTAELLSQWPK